MVKQCVDMTLYSLQPAGTNAVTAWDNPIYGIEPNANSEVSIPIESEDHHSPPSRRGTGVSFSAVAVAKNPRYERLPSPPPSSQSAGRDLSTDYHHYEVVSNSNQNESEGDYATIEEFTGTK